MRVDTSFLVRYDHWLQTGNGKQLTGNRRAPVLHYLIPKKAKYALYAGTRPTKWGSLNIIPCWEFPSITKNLAQPYPKNETAVPVTELKKLIKYHCFKDFFPRYPHSLSLNRLKERRLGARFSAFRMVLKLSFPFQITVKKFIANFGNPSRMGGASSPN
ncbi:hypothetical protein C8R45DRAFT_936737 [Mycena sanguinolenta]|nr:hypothetical protein C8R45DRAFT_936737 [Mycena sanguinolenta]